MTESQRQLVLDLALGRIDRPTLCERFGVDLGDPQATVDLLSQAYETGNGEDVECAIIVAAAFGYSREHVRVLNALLLETWHTRHEDVALALEELHDASSVDALFQAALFELPYLDYDENYGLARKRTWALAKIGTPESHAKLRSLAECDNQIIRAYALKRL